MTPNFPNLVKYINLEFQEAQRTPNSINSKRTMHRHITVKALKMNGKEYVFLNETHVAKGTTLI